MDGANGVDSVKGVNDVDGVNSANGVETQARARKRGGGDTQANRWVQ